MARRVLRFVPKKAEWERFNRALDPQRFRRLSRKHLRKATERNGLEAVATIRRTIRKGGSFAANAMLTKEIKGSSKPLVDSGSGLFQAVTSKIDTDTSVFVGVLQTDGFYNIAKAIHDGVVIPVTPKMRQMFKALWWASIGNLDPSELDGRAAELWKRKPGGWFPLKDSTVAIVLPPRPFVELAFADPALKKKARANWERAMNSAIREAAKK